MFISPNVFCLNTVQNLFLAEELCSYALICGDKPDKGLNARKYHHHHLLSEHCASCYRLGSTTCNKVDTFDNKWLLCTDVCVCVCVCTGVLCNVCAYVCVTCCTYVCVTCCTICVCDVLYICVCTKGVQVMFNTIACIQTTVKTLCTECDTVSLICTYMYTDYYPRQGTSLLCYTSPSTSTTMLVQLIQCLLIHN